MENLIPETKSNFIKIRCKGCKNEQIVFSKLSSEVKCLVCDKILCKPSGGKADIKAEILEVLE